MKRKIIISMIVIAVVLAVAIGVFGADKWFNAGSKVKDISQDESLEVAAKVGGAEITKNDVDKMMALYELQEAQYQTASAEAESKGLAVPPKKVWDYDSTLNKMIEDELLYQEAKSKGYEASTEEAQKYAEQTRETIQKIVSGEIDTPNRDDAIKSYNNLKEFIKGLGTTEDEYWKSLVPEYQRALTIGKLRKEILSGIPAEKRNDSEYVDSYMKSYIDKLEDKYKVEVFD
ncbi:MAG: SurA N-terminal domain-containing protein [Thermoanaerobacteraceae bacterium]|nr:SurA N-terminal domain-containing protein [Thermoanaerobacteraceae bacterium]